MSSEEKAKPLPLGLRRANLRPPRAARNHSPPSLLSYLTLTITEIYSKRTRLDRDRRSEFWHFWSPLSKSGSCACLYRSLNGFPHLSSPMACLAWARNRPGTITEMRVTQNSPPSLLSVTPSPFRCSVESLSARRISELWGLERCCMSELQP